MYRQILKRQEFLRAEIDDCLRVINAAPPGKPPFHGTCNHSAAIFLLSKT